MNQDKISISDHTYKEINDIFNFLKSFVRNNSKDTSKSGMPGWSDEERRVHHDIIFKINDGGYSSTLISLKYNFNIMSGYQFDIGSYFTFWFGDLSSLRKCFNEINDFNDIAKEKESVIH